MSGSAVAAGTWSPFRHRDFALLWTAALLSNTGTWMHDAAAGWLMTTLDPTPAMVALVQAATTLPVFLLAIPAGALADRADHRRLMLLVQVCMMSLAATLGLLVLTHHVGIASLLLVTFGLGVGTALGVPIWQAMLPQLVARASLPPAIALHAVGINVSRAIGPALGGALILAFGMAWPFILNSISFVAIIAALWMWRPVARPAHAVVQESLLASIGTGIRQALAIRHMRNTLLRSVGFFFAGSAYWALLPLVAREHLQGEAGFFGVLVGCIGAGGVLGALWLSRLRQRFGLDGALLAGSIGTAIATAGYALVEAKWLGLVTSFLAGASWITALSSLNVAAQLAVPDAIRARGMALYSAVFYGCLAVGSVVWGHVATALSLSGALLLAAMGSVLALLMGRRWPVAQPVSAG